MEQKKTVLSIGMIFKNESRCLERCLKSLEPLRKAVPSELVMADTGSTDNSRGIAARYADVLFDFPWINDFAAARNAVIDRCSGEWYLNIDADEWLGEDITRLVQFLTEPQEFDFGGLIIRNYKTADLEKGGNYSDFTACRLARLSTGLRYEGAIHEHWPTDSKELHMLLLRDTILHHDGYALEDKARAREKMERNLFLLRKQLEEQPDNLTALLQCAESSDHAPEEHLYYVRRAADAVERRVPTWDLLGPAIFRYAVLVASNQKLPELDEWIQRAEAWFPDSMYTKVDVNYIAFGSCWDKGDYEACIRRGNAYFQVMRDMDAGNFEPGSTLFSSLLLTSALWRQKLSIFMASAYLYLDRPEDAYELVRDLDGSRLDADQVRDLTRVWVYLQGKSMVDLTMAIPLFWAQIGQAYPAQAHATTRRRVFLDLMRTVFTTDYRARERAHPKYRRDAYTLLLPLEARCDLGRAAAALWAAERGEIAEKLRLVEDWEEIPDAVVEYAILQGVRFPLAENPLYMEQMDTLAGRLAKESGAFSSIAAKAAENPSREAYQALVWQCSLAMAVVRACDWTDEWAGAEVCRLFAAAEQRFIGSYYHPQLLSKEHLYVLPPLHRFGWYYVQAAQALEGGDELGYVRALKEGLNVCPGMKGMVDFLLRQRERKAEPPENAELLALAEKIRNILAASPPPRRPGGGTA